MGFTSATGQVLVQPFPFDVCKYRWIRTPWWNVCFNIPHYFADEKIPAIELCAMEAADHRDIDAIAVVPVVCICRSSIIDHRSNPNSKRALASSATSHLLGAIGSNISRTADGTRLHCAHRRVVRKIFHSIYTCELHSMHSIPKRNLVEAIDISLK